MNYILIHVGKCSGTAVKNSLIKHKIDIQIVHHCNKRCENDHIIPEHFIKKINNCQFIFCIRHPIDRMISAFNFKYTRGIIRKGQDHFDGEIDGFKYFKTIQNLAENLYNDDGSENKKAITFCSNCDHIAYGLHHYLNNFNKNHNIRVIRHEYLKQDYKNVFNKDIYLETENYQPNFISNIDSKFRKENKMEFTKKAYNNLKRFLNKDFNIIERLAKYNLITNEYKDFCLNKLPDNIHLID